MKTSKYFVSSKTISTLFGCAFASTLMGCSAINSVENEAQGLSNDAKAAVIAPAPIRFLRLTRKGKRNLLSCPFKKPGLNQASTLMPIPILWSHLSTPNTC